MAHSMYIYGRHRNDRVRWSVPTKEWSGVGLIYTDKINQSELYKKLLQYFFSFVNSLLPPRTKCAKLSKHKKYYLRHSVTRARIHCC